MSRRAHWLKANLSSEQPHSVCYVDTETRPDLDACGVQHHRLRFGWACYERTRTGRKWTPPEWFRFTRAVDFWSWLESRIRSRTRTHVFAHNWSFDAPVLKTWDVLADRGWTQTRAIVESPPVILTFRRDSLTIEMLDTLNWWRMSLAKVGESLGLPKLPMPSPDASRAEWDVYARRDVEILRQALHAWWDFLVSHDLGGFARTLAGQAMRTYRHKYMDFPILIDEDDEAQRLARESYHGGRVEAFRIGRVEGPIHCFDVNSMYPFVMRDQDFPRQLVRRIRVLSVPELAEWSKRYAVVARCRIETKRNRFAHLHGDRLCFPVGRFVTALTTPDVLDALHHGEVRAVEECALYERAPIFARFVTDLYQLRLDATDQGNEVQRWLLKILMNALYGKFGQKGNVWEPRGQAETRDVRVWREYDVVEGTERWLRCFGGSLQEKATREEARDSHPAIASHVTAYARAYLWDLIQRVDPGSVVYCDTDSLMLRDTGKARLADKLSEQHLGGLKREWEVPWIEVYGAKDYRTPLKRVCKGVREKARWIDSATVEQEQWSSLPGMIRDGQLQAPTTRLVRKHLSRAYDKGDVGPGGTVSPLVLSEW